MQGQLQIALLARQNVNGLGNSAVSVHQATINGHQLCRRLQVLETKHKKSKFWQKVQIFRTNFVMHLSLQKFKLHSGTIHESIGSLTACDDAE
jgi:hypothetical protein